MKYKLKNCAKHREQLSNLTVNLPKLQEFKKSIQIALMAKPVKVSKVTTMDYNSSEKFKIQSKDSQAE